MRLRIAFVALFALLASGVSPSSADEAARAATIKALNSGKLEEGAALLTEMIASDGLNDEARFGLGMVRFVQSVEHLSQGLYRYGLQPPQSMLLPLVRLPVPVNRLPDPIDYKKFRALLQRFADDLAVADKVLSRVRAPETKIVVDLATVRYDADGNGAVGEDERLSVVLARIMDIDIDEMAGVPTMVGFDVADAIWLRGYSHVLMALSEFLLAHDWRESFDVSFHVFFPRAESAFQKALGPRGDSFLASEVSIADLISFLHIRWPVAEPKRMRAVREHLKTVVALSRDNWAAINAEADNDKEWIPNPKQVAITGTAVTAEQIDAWHKVLDQADLLLDGKKLMPHWRMQEGINLRKVFEKPQPFDLVLWITGPATMPFLEDGDVLTSAEWGAIISAFGNSFGSYAIWFN